VRKKRKEERRRAAQNVQEWTIQVGSRSGSAEAARKKEERKEGEASFFFSFPSLAVRAIVRCRSVFFFLIAAVVATIASFSCPSIKKVPFPLLELPVLTISFLAQFDRMFIFFLLVRRSLDC